MKRGSRMLFLCLPVVMVLVQCSSNKKETKEKKESAAVEYRAGDREGISDSIKDISASEDITELLCQRWDNKDDDEAVRQSGGGGDLELPLRGLYFFADHAAVKDPRGDMQTGTWDFDKDNKRITATFGGQKEQYKVMAISFDELVLKKEEEGAKQVYYKADGFVNKYKAADPFQPENMQWRIPPDASETDAALRKRLKGHLHFYYLFYIDNQQRNLADISFYGLPGCFKWYAGGIHLKQEKDLDKSWKSIFYNEKDASRGYGIMDKLLSKKYKWGDKNESWLLLNAGVLKQMENRIDSL